MKTFEEKWTAWLDDELHGAERAQFEAALPDRAAAESEKRDAQRLRALLKEQLAPQSMANEDFFSHQLRERIAAENRPAKIRSRGESMAWPIGRLIWMGATSLAVFAICAFFVMREGQPADQSQYLSQILNARVDPAVSPNATISMFQAKEDKVTVLWVDGLQSLPAEFASK